MVAGVRTRLGLMGPPAHAIPAVAPKPLHAPRAARHVAVCDDDLPLIRYVERALGLAGVRVLPVTTLDPSEGVRVVAEAGCDAALIDLHIYNDDHAGLTLVRLLRANPSTAKLRLVLVTRASLRDLKRHDAFLREHECGVLTKPFPSDALLASLGLVLPDRPAA
jgi:CheY-like chemotaxis protein